jgi:hypothetical protein
MLQFRTVPEPILQLPHETHRLPFLVSRASVPSADVVWIWRKGAGR